MPTVLSAVLTKEGVDRVEVRRREYRIWDARVRWLCLRILPTGRKLYEMRAGRRSLILGHHPMLSPKVARERAVSQWKSFCAANLVLDAAKQWRGEILEVSQTIAKSQPELEMGPLSGQGDELAGIGVTPSAGRTIAQIKRAKAANLDSRSTRKRVA